MLGRAFFFVGAARSDQLEFGPRPLARTDELITIGGRAVFRDGLADTRFGLEDEPRSILVDGEGPQIQVGRLLTDELNFLVGTVVALIEPEPAVRTVIEHGATNRVHTPGLIRELVKRAVKHNAQCAARLVPRRQNFESSEIRSY